MPVPMAIAARIPWKDILKAAPAVLNAAERLWKRWNEQQQAVAPSPKTGGDTQYLVKRVARLEQAELSQTELVREMAAQANALTEALRVVAVRTAVAIVLAAIGCVAAIAGILVAIAG